MSHRHESDIALQLLLAIGEQPDIASVVRPFLCAATNRLGLQCAAILFNGIGKELYLADLYSEPEDGVCLAQCKSFIAQLDLPDTVDRAEHRSQTLLLNKRQYPTDIFRLPSGADLLFVGVSQRIPLSLLRTLLPVIGKLSSRISNCLEAIRIRTRAARLSEATATAGIGIFDWNVDTGTMHWDPQMKQLFQVAPSNYTGRPEDFSNRLHPEDRNDLLDRVATFIEHASDGSDVAEYTFRVIDDTGEVKKLLAHCRLRKNPDGTLSLAGTNYDISELERARAQTLFRSELEQLLLQLSMQVILSSANDLNHIINSALRDVGQFVGADRAYRFSYDFDRDLASNTHEWCAAGIEPQIEQLQNSSINDIPYWVNAHQRGLPFYMSRVTDLPPDHGLRQILDPQEVLSIVTIPLMRADECLGFIGFDSVKQTRHWSDVDISVLKILGQLLVNAQVKTDNEQQLQTTKLALQKSRDKAQRMAQKAIDANEAKTRFVASVSHELRTPLHAIIGLTDILNESILHDEMSGQVAAIRKSGSILLELINDILYFSQAESGNTKVHSTAFDLHELVTSLQQELLIDAESKGLDIRLEIMPEVPKIVAGDSLRLRQVLNNLVGNAIKFTGEGHINITVARAVDSSGHECYSIIDFTVTDTGIGIAKEHIQRIFEPFVQVDDSDQRRFAGTGLGLSIVRTLAELMKGTVSVDSNIGDGARFIFRLPLPAVASLPNQADSHNTSKTQPLPSMRVPRVLIAEDNPLNCELLKLYLQDQNLDLEIANNGETALQMQRRNPADVILMDCQMPVMDGFSATRAIRSEEPGPKRIPIIAVTASAQPDHEEACMDAGFSDVLIKPFSKADVIEALYRWLHNRNH